MNVSLHVGAAGRCLLASLALLFILIGNALSAEPCSIAGVYPHLAMFNEEGECGTGAVVPWAGRLWVVTYAPHKPQGSTDKLYEITPTLEQIIRPESIGGTPANRFIHRESQQLFIGPYAIDARGQVRVIPYSTMFGRHTGVARHLTEPARKVVYATMEEGIYEVDVQTLAVTELWADEQRKEGRHANLPGYHGKGFYSAQGRYVYANNGEHGPEAQRRPDVPSGCLAEWDGRAPQWTIVRRNQFTEVTGPGGIEGNPPGDDRLWSIGWDYRSLILMILEEGRWQAWRLPKASHAYDGAHGWNTEWPRIRDIGEEGLLMTMHGMFWRFPKTFSHRHSAGLAPRSTYLKVIGDFCRWGGRVVMGCDDTARSEFLNKHPLKGDLAAPGKSQSNLWFVNPEELDHFGPPLGRGAVWLDDDVPAGTPSEPYLLAGFKHRMLFLRHGGAQELTLEMETDLNGTGQWRKSRTLTVPPAQGVCLYLEDEPGVWMRLRPTRNATNLTAFFHYRGEDNRPARPDARFDGLATPHDMRMSGGLLHARGEDFRTLRCLARNAHGELGVYDLDGELRLSRTNDPAGAAWTAKAVALAPALIHFEEGAAVYTDPEGRRWRLPLGDPVMATPGPLGPERVCREVCTERNLLNVGGLFYEMPAENAGGFAKLRPIATHNLRIHDFASYRGLLVLSGVAAKASGPRIVRSADGQCALWVGVVDDLWALGKPRGMLGIWQQKRLAAGAASDACLMTGFDRKTLEITHTNPAPARFHIEADIAGNGQWSRVFEVEAPPAKTFRFSFPPAFGAYWVRLIPQTEVTATATLIYE